VCVDSKWLTFARVFRGLAWRACMSRHHVPLPNKPSPSGLPFPFPLPLLGITTSPRLTAQIPDRCPLSRPRWLPIANGNEHHLQHGSAWLRGPAKVCGAQTKFSAFQQPCYRTSLKLRATSTASTKGREHYSVTWAYVACQSGRASVLIGLACLLIDLLTTLADGPPLCNSSVVQRTYLARLNTVPFPLAKFRRHS
jgi:hypothetical protein